jgi:SHS2 domain-containing protein
MSRRPPRFRQAATTADAGLIAWGGTREELFENAALGLARIMADPRCVRPLEVRPLAAAGSDLGALLAAWLGELVYLFDAEGFLGREFTVHRLAPGRVEGSARGERYDAGRHRLRDYVKGVSYHRLEVREAGGRWRARLVLDL